jgi:tetratricopeptide (TPR) repeat protein
MITRREVWVWFGSVAFVCVAIVAAYYLTCWYQSKPIPGRAEFEEGRAKWACNQWKEAIEKFDAAIQLNQNQALAHYYCANCYENDGQTGPAIDEYGKAIGVHKEIVDASGNREDQTAVRLSEELYDAYLNRGKLLEKAGNRWDAIADFSEAIKVSRDRPEAYCARGIAFLKDGMPGLAFEDLSAAIHLDRHSAEAFYHRGRACLELKKHEDAIRDCQTAIRLDPKCGDVFRVLFSALLSSQPPRFAEAEECLRDSHGQKKTLDRQSKHELAQAHFDWGVRLAKVGEVEESDSEFKQALALEPGYSSEAERYRKKYFPTPSLSSSDGAAMPIEGPEFKRRWREASALLEQGLLHKAKGNPEAAKDAFEKAITGFNNIVHKNHTYAPAWCERGLAFLERGSPESAIDDFSEAIRLNSNYNPSYCRRGRAYTEIGDYMRAVEDCTKAIRLMPSETAAYHYRAIAYVKSGKYDRALADLDVKVLSLDSDLETQSRYWRAEAYQRRGLAKIEAKRWDEAIADLHKAMDVEPSRAKQLGLPLVAAYRGRGLARASRNQCDEAISDLTKAVQLDPNNAQSYRDRGLTYCRMARLETAEIEDGRGSNARMRQIWESARADLSRAILLDSDLESRLERVLAEAQRKSETNSIPAVVSQAPGI